MIVESELWLGSGIGSALSRRTGYSAHRHPMTGSLT
jgi:hypothetical protein